MTVIGAIQAFQEADKIADAVESLFACGCDRVVVLDGAWQLPDGTPFGDSHELLSTDETATEAERAGAIVVYPTGPMYGDGGKRHALIRSLNANHHDHVLILDADERVVGSLDRGNLPTGHAVVILRNLRENDLPGIRGTFPSGDYGPVVPLIRWLLWTPGLRCDGPGRYANESGPIRPYVDEIEDWMTPMEMCALPILPGVEILHNQQPSPERVAAKIRYYEAVAG